MDDAPARNWSPEDVARDLDARAATNALYCSARRPLATGQHMAWRVAPEPWRIGAALAERIFRLGPHLHAFYQAANRLYLESVNGARPAWVHALLDQGKPTDLVAFQRAKRFRDDTPRVIRPDLIETEDGRLVICELDSVPGGIGLTARMADDYARYGLGVLGGADGLVEAFAAMIRDVARKPAPSLAIVVSEESSDYWHEQVYLGDRLRRRDLPTLVVRPDALRDHGADGVSAIDPATGAAVAVDVVYRFFELFDLANVPQSALLQYAAQGARVAVTPPYKAHLEEKLLFALYQHPALAGFWRAALPGATRDVLDEMLPRTWVLDPAPLPPQAVYPDLVVNGAAITDFRQLIDTTKKERDFVVKPSGFSPAAWGSRGVKFGIDSSAADWRQIIESALDAFPQTPHILQRHHKPAKTSARYFRFDTGQMAMFDARARLCPYYFVVGDEVRFGGMNVTLCPLDKHAIHGMSEAVMVPAGAPIVDRSRSIH
jgi:hypothetical protein